jgi:hypothetical protein
MTLATATWAVPAASLVIYVAIQVPAARLIGQRRSLRWSLIMMTALIPLVACAAARFPARDSEAALLVYACILYVVVCPLILGFYASIDHSVRIRLCVEFHKARGKPLRYSEISKRYDVHAASVRRFGKLVSGGYAVRRDDRYVLTPKGRWMSRALHRVKKLCNTLEYPL